MSCLYDWVMIFFSGIYWEQSPSYFLKGTDESNYGYLQRQVWDMSQNTVFQIERHDSSEAEKFVFNVWHHL